MKEIKTMGFSQGLRKASTSQLEALGTVRVMQNGKVYRYVKAGTNGLTAGKMAVAPAATANHINKALAADVAVGSKRVSITVGATAVTENQYAGGNLAVNDGTGEGTFYRIVSNSACDASVRKLTLCQPIA